MSERKPEPERCAHGYALTLGVPVGCTRCLGESVPIFAPTGERAAPQQEPDWAANTSTNVPAFATIAGEPERPSADVKFADECRVIGCFDMRMGESLYCVGHQHAPSQPGGARDQVIPGAFECAKCGVVLQASVLSARNGAIAADEAPQRCPNDCGPMWPLTYKKALRDLMDRTDVAPALAERDRLREALAQCETWFTEYALIHERKGDTEKSKRNADRAAYARRALNGLGTENPETGKTEASDR